MDGRKDYSSLFFFSVYGKRGGGINMERDSGQCEGIGEVGDKDGK